MQQDCTMVFNYSFVVGFLSLFSIGLGRLFCTVYCVAMDHVSELNLIGLDWIESANAKRQLDD